MEKKEIQKWRDRLIKMFGIYHSDGQEYVTCPLCGINLETLAFLDELAKHMIEELDKAREEGEIKGRLEALPITIEEIKNAKMKLLKRIISKYRKMGSSAGDYAMVYIEEELSKLKTKEDESKNKR